MDEKQISPEEKLLKVIQGNGGKSGTPTPEEKMLNAAKAPAGSAGSTQKTVEAGKSGAGPKPAEPQAKGQLKLKPTPVAAGKPEAKGKPEGGVSGSAQGVGGPKAEAPAPVPVAQAEIRKNSQGSSFFQKINMALGFVVLLVIGLSGYEIYAGISTFDSIKKKIQIPSGDGGAISGATEVQLPDPYDINAVLKSFVDRPWSLPDLEKPSEDGGGIVETIKIINVPWQTYAKENYKLMGFAGPDPATAEAIVSDKKENKLHFLAVGGRIDIMGAKINVAEVQKDYVLLSDGKGSLQIK